jgi:hypothetical protein
MGREGGGVGGRDAWESGKRRSVGPRTKRSTGMGLCGSYELNRNVGCKYFLKQVSLHHSERP